MQQELHAKDYIRFHYLRELKTKQVVHSLWFESDGRITDLLTCKSGNNPIYQVNNFRVIEDFNNNMIVFRPRVIGCNCKMYITTTDPVTVDIVNENNSGTGAGEGSAHSVTVTLKPGKNTINLMAIGIQSYRVSISSENNSGKNTDIHPVNEPIINTTINTAKNDFKKEINSNTRNEFKNDYNSVSGREIGAGIGIGMGIGAGGCNDTGFISTGSHISDSIHDREMEQRARMLEQTNNRLGADNIILRDRVNDLEEKKQSLSEEKRTLIERLEKLQTEYDRDYDMLSRDLEDIRGRYQIDRELIRQYQDQDIRPIDQMFQQIESEIEMIEERIRTFVLAKERKTAEIESELAVGKNEK